MESPNLSDSPTEDPTNEKLKRDRAEALLIYTFKKLNTLITLKKLVFDIIEDFTPYLSDYYYNTVMGFDKKKLTYNDNGKTVSINTYKDYILDDNIFNMVKKFIDNIEYKGDKYTLFTLRDAVGLLVGVSISNPNNPADPSDYCKARDIFISILLYIKTKTPYSWAQFEYSSSGGLLKSSKICKPPLKDRIGPNTDPLDTVDPTKTSSVVLTISDVPVLGGAKSRRIRRRKHNRKTHRKHARKTHHKRASKSHKRSHRSRAARKYKKHTSRR